jgi:hypothetical protein
MVGHMARHMVGHTVHNHAPIYKEILIHMVGCTV